MPLLKSLRERAQHAALLAGAAAVLAGVAAVGLGAGAVVSWLENAPGIVHFDVYDPPEATTLYDRTGKPFASLFEQRRIVVELRSLPHYVPDAFIAIEDRNFHAHFGIDPKGIARAALVNAWRRTTSQGASTITQQLARNLVGRVGTEKTLERKLREVLVALQMERSYTKEQILEVYLNQIYLGSGAYGIESAAQSYFGKAARELGVGEAAVLAGLPQLPERYSPLNNAAAAERRRDQVLGAMLELGYIDDAQYGEHASKPVVVAEGGQLGSRIAPYFVDAVRREISATPLLEGESLRRLGWSLKTTLDLHAQEVAEKALRDGLEAEEPAFFAARQERFKELVTEPEYFRPAEVGQVRMARVRRVFGRSLVVELPGGWRGDFPIPAHMATYFGDVAGIVPGAGVDIRITEMDESKRLLRGELLPRSVLQGAAVVIDSTSGQVIALAGGRDFADAANNGAYNRAVMARRQAGSTLKPLFFAPSLERGNGPESSVVDSPITFPDGYAPRNYENRFLGVTTFQRAMEKSANAATIRVVRDTGLRTSIAFVRQFQRAGRRPWDMPDFWPVVLGATDVTPLELAGAYQPFAALGTARGPHLILGVWNEEGREKPFADGRDDAQLLQARTAALMSQMLAGVMQNGTGRATRDLLPEDLRDRVAGKTGTTNDNRDAWFAGWTPYETIIVWVGFDDSIPMGPGRTGGHTAGPIWARIAGELWNQRNAGERSVGLPIPPGYPPIPAPQPEAIASPRPVPSPADEGAPAEAFGTPEVVIPGTEAITDDPAPPEDPTPIALGR